jgi:hypothetical protein
MNKEYISLREGTDMDKTELEKARSEVRLTQLEIDANIIKTDIKSIKNNHLAHIESNMGSLDRKLDKLDTRVWSILFGIVILALSNIVATVFA